MIKIAHCFGNTIAALCHFNSNVIVRRKKERLEKNNRDFETSSLQKKILFSDKVK
jgi:hypothetical protein